MIFSEIVRRYITETNKKVVVLTHRIELSKQTSKMLTEFNVVNKVINSEVKELDDQDQYMCFVAMVETLNNRIEEDKLDIKNIGLVIVDEAHYNSFLKLFKYFENSFILGVTATPLSSNIKLPMKDNYEELIVGETIPSLIETEVIVQILDDTPDVWAWLSFSCRDGTHLNDGTPIRDALAACADVERIAAVGVNCTPPRFMPELISEIRAHTDLPVVVYPNSGETYDAVSKSWSGDSAGAETGATWGDVAAEWVEAGASLVGGCCRVTASDISDVRSRVVSLG